MKNYPVPSTLSYPQKVLWPLVTVYSFIYLGLMVADFLLLNRWNMPGGFMALYMALVAVYAGNKEILRWVSQPPPAKWGSFFVYAWFLFFAAAYLVKSAFPAYDIPPDLPKVCLQVLGVFFVSKASGKIYSVRKGSKEKEEASLPSGEDDRVLALLNERKKVTRKDVASLLTVSSATAGRILQGLEKEKKIKQSGSGRGACYIIK